MTKYLKFSIILAIILVAANNTFATNYKDINWLKTAIDRSQEQLLKASESYKYAQKNPRTFIIAQNTLPWQLIR